MSALMCRVTRAVPDGLGPRWWIDRHRDACLRCQAAVARERGIGRELAVLSQEVLPAPATLVPRVMARIGVQDASDPRRPLVARLAARYAAAAGVAVATGVAVFGGALRRRSRALG